MDAGDVMTHVSDGDTIPVAAPVMGARVGLLGRKPML